MMARTLFLLGFAAALLTGVGCSNGSSGGSTTVALSCSDGGAAGANVVTMSCGGETDATTEQVNFVMGGPAAGTTTLQGLNFDVTYDPARVEFVPAASYTSPRFPGAIVLVQLFNDQQGRVVVSIQQTAGVLESVGPGQHDVLSLSFRSLTGTTFGLAPLTFENTEATNASTPVSFVGGLALSYQ